MMNEVLTVRRRAGLSDLAGLRDEWKEMLQYIGSTHPSSPFTVVQSMFIHCCGNAGTPEIWTAHRGARLVGALILTREQLRFGMGTAQLRTPGDHDAYPLPLFVRADEPDTAAALLLASFRSQKGVIRLCLIRQQGRQVFDRVAELAPDVLFSVFPGGYGSVLRLPSSDVLFWESLSANFRKNLRKQRRRLEAAGAVSWRFLRGEQCTDREIEAFLALEASGWKGEEGGAILRRPRAASYYRDVLSGLAREGRLELHQLLLDGRCIAVQVGVRSESVLNLLKITYDEGAAHLAPGNMLLLELVLREIAAGSTTELDCLTDMVWHRNWAMVQREFVDVHVYSRTFRALSVGYLPRTALRCIRESPLVRRAARSISHLRHQRLRPEDATRD